MENLMAVRKRFRWESNGDGGFPLQGVNAAVKSVWRLIDFFTLFFSILISVHDFYNTKGFLIFFESVYFYEGW